MISTVIKLAITVVVVRQPHTCLACKTFSTLEMSGDIKTFYCFHYDLETLRCCFTKTICSISFKLTAFTNDTLGFPNINFLRDQWSFKVDINLYNIHLIISQLCYMVLKV